MNEIQAFNYQSNEIRTVTRNGEPWFVLKDVCMALGLAKPSNVATRLDDDERGACLMGTPSGDQNMVIINESGLYSVILRSDKPEAKPFRKWVTSEVLPSIRKTGAYSANRPQEPQKSALAEAKLNNSRARLASVWLKLAQINPVPEYQQICASYASAALAGRDVLPLPEVREKTYTAAEVGQMLGGVSANMVGRLANQHSLKAPGYGIQVWDKSPHSAKQVPAWRYNARAVEKLKEILQK